MLRRWKPWLPPEPSQGYQQGGAFVFQGRPADARRHDVSTGSHAPLNEVFDAAGVTEA